MPAVAKPKKEGGAVFAGMKKLLLTPCMISQSEPKRAWWIHKSLLLASSNPADCELAWLRAQGFKVAVSLLEEHSERPRYDRASATRGGWSIYSMPISEGAAPSL